MAEAILTTYGVFIFEISNYAENSATLSSAVNCIFKEICMLLSV